MKINIEGTESYIEVNKDNIKEEILKYKYVLLNFIYKENRCKIMSLSDKPSHYRCGRQCVNMLTSDFISVFFDLEGADQIKTAEGYVFTNEEIDQIFNMVIEVTGFLESGSDYEPRSMKIKLTPNEEDDLFIKVNENNIREKISEYRYIFIKFIDEERRCNIQFLSNSETGYKNNKHSVALLTTDFIENFFEGEPKNKINVVGGFFLTEKQITQINEMFKTLLGFLREKW